MDELITAVCRDIVKDGPAQEIAKLAVEEARMGTYDYATSCSTENSLVIEERVYGKFIEYLKADGGYLVNKEEKEKLQKGMWVNGVLNRDIVAQPAQAIGKMAGIDIPEDEKFILAEKTGIGTDYSFSGEKLLVLMTLYKYKGFPQAIEKVNAITGYQGSGHS